MRKKPFRPLSNRTALFAALGLSVFLNAIIFLARIYNGHDITSSPSMTITFIENFIIFYVLFLFNFRIIQKEWKFENKMIVLVVGSLLIAIILSIVLSWAWIKALPTGSNISLKLLTTIILSISLTATAIVVLLTMLHYVWDQRLQNIINKQTLITENIRNRYEALKNQVNPHFLFNSLNTLNGLIGFDDDKAHEYVEKLSFMFRYTMQHNTVLQLEKELNFIKSYIYLMKIRYSDNLQVEINCNEKYNAYYIMPFSLQLLIENAVKHNVISNKYPLVITVDVTDHDSIRVRNVIRLKSDVDGDNGKIGLANLSERYQLLFHKEIIITNNSGIFCVEIPLVKELETTKRM